MLQFLHNAGKIPGVRMAAEILVAGFFLGLLIRAVRRSDEPGHLILKWVLTLPTLAGILALGHHVDKAVGEGWDMGAAFFCAISAAALGLGLAILWRHNIANFVARPIGALFTGDDTESVSRPLYSIAIANRKRGKYAEAVAYVRRELEKSPTDFEGQWLLAEIQAENMNHLAAAESTVMQLAGQPVQTPHSIAFALNGLADWHLKYAKDRPAALRLLEKIIELYPDSEMSAFAAQRIAHLSHAEPEERKFVVTEGSQNLGLLGPEFQPVAPEIRPERQAADLVEHLQHHPLDTEARESLALIYAGHYNRLDLAAAQLEQLIADSNQPAKRAVHWLNLLADLQIRHGAAEPEVRATLNRIRERFPDSPAAHVADGRLSRLKLELRINEKSQTVKLGSPGRPGRQI